MKILIKNSYIYDPYGECFHAGDLLIDGDRISAVGRFELDADLTLDAEGAFLLPGFVDVHTHGRDGYDFTDADETAKERGQSRQRLRSPNVAQKNGKFQRSAR